MARVTPTQAKKKARAERFGITTAAAPAAGAAAAGSAAAKGVAERCAQDEAVHSGCRAYS